MNRRGAPDQPCARAERPLPRPPVRVGRVVLGLALVGLGLRFLALGMSPRLVPAVIVLGGAWLAYEALGFGTGPDCEVTPHRIYCGGGCRKLEEVAAARLDWHRSAVWTPWRPALLLEFGRETWALDLGLEGWYGVWDCLRELRPDLELPDWRRHPGVLKLLTQRRRHGVRLPPGVVVHEPSVAVMGVTAGLAAAFAELFVLLAPGPAAASWELPITAAAAGLAVWLYTRMDPPKLDYVPPSKNRSRSPNPTSGPM